MTALLLPSSDWRLAGLCSNVRTAADDLWYSEHPDQLAAAKTICRGCPVADPCLEAALTRADAYGIQGGLNVDERNAVARLRGIRLAVEGQWEHGTPAGFKAHGCRCDACRAAHRHEARQYRQRAPRRAATRPLIVVHELATPAGRGRFRAYPGQLYIGGIQ